jgi:hypothetical protein
VVARPPRPATAPSIGADALIDSVAGMPGSYGFGPTAPAR